MKRNNKNKNNKRKKKKKKNIKKKKKKIRIIKHKRNMEQKHMTQKLLRRMYKRIILKDKFLEIGV
jgi:hypothetical protein